SENDHSVVAVPGQEPGDVGHFRFSIQGDHACLALRLQGLPGGLVVSGAPHQGLKAVATRGEAVAGHAPTGFGHQQPGTALLDWRQVNIDAPLPVVSNVALSPQVTREPVEDHRADERVQVMMAPIKTLGGCREPEATGSCYFADNTAVLSRRQMV